MKLKSLTDAFNKADDWLFEKTGKFWVGVKIGIGVSFIAPTTMRYAIGHRGPQSRNLDITSAPIMGNITGNFLSITPALVGIAQANPAYAAAYIITQSTSTIYETVRHYALRRKPNAKASL